MPLRTTARRLAGNSYFLSKRYALARMKRREPPVVVFSMGKTGSTAIARAVQDATGDRVFQIFRLEAERLRQAERRYRLRNREAKREGRDPGALPFSGALHLWESEYLLEHPPTPAAPWSVITTVREPIAQAVSAFFHGSRRRGALTDSSTIETLTQLFLTERWIREPLRWFDREFAPALGIDVFEHPFDTERGYGVIETPSARVLILRQENLASAPDALARFLGRDRSVPVAPRNQAATKGYAATYREFLDAVRVPADVCDEAYGSRYARHFYADSELVRLRRRWEVAPMA
jgi:Putative capsular polysaccharide synthesis protein